MMATTHAFLGLLLAAVVATVAPEFAVAAAVGGVLGGIFPDLDVAGAHRRTLHFPVYYWVPTVPAVALALFLPTETTVAVALFFLAAALHSASDVLGGGLEPRPWEGTSEKAVYVHPLGRWLRPRQVIRYDGAPEDFLVGAVLAAPALLVYDAGPVRTAVYAGLAVSLVYTLVRRRMMDVVPERWL